jgi:hypothetical protein
MTGEVSRRLDSTGPAGGGARMPAGLNPREAVIEAARHGLVSVETGEWPVS